MEALVSPRHGFRSSASEHARCRVAVGVRYQTENHKVPVSWSLGDSNS